MYKCVYGVCGIILRSVEGRVVLDDDKCIRCKDCTTRCPVNALNLVIDEEGLNL